MDSDLIARSETLLTRLQDITELRRNGQQVSRHDLKEIHKDLVDLSGMIPDVEGPVDVDELLSFELKKKLSGYAFCVGTLERSLSLEEGIELFNIPRADIDSLRPWLEEDRDRVIDLMSRFRNRDAVYDDYASPVPEDMSRQAEKFTKDHLDNYHQALGSMQSEYLRGFLKHVNVMPTKARSARFNTITLTAEISPHEVTYLSTKGEIKLCEREMIRLYGHEVLGHGLNHALTAAANLPIFIGGGSPSVRSTQESIALFYQRKIFDDINKSPEIQRELETEDRWDQISKEAALTAEIDSYQANLYHYAITVLADKSMGDPTSTSVIKKKIKMLDEVSLNSEYASNFFRDFIGGLDEHGNPHEMLLTDLAYCAQPVERALQEFTTQGIAYEGENRTAIDAILLTGLWTPEGYVHNARIQARQMA